MKIYYQGNPGSYMHIASLEIEKNLDLDVESVEWKPNFLDVWEKIGDQWIWILAIENSYMWSIHANIYNFLKYDYKIIWEYFLEINHCLCSKEDDISLIKKAYSQKPALEQCYNFLKDKCIEPVDYSDTSLSARFVSESSEKWLAAICSEKAATLNNLNILEKNIQDQSWNTTRFIVIVPNDSTIKYNKDSNRISLVFETKHIPSSLYKCLWIFAENNINLTKIESIPSYKWKFDYMFWIDIDTKVWKNIINDSLEKLKEFTSYIKIIWEY